MSAGEGESQQQGGSVKAFAHAFWKFLRPHTIRGTVRGAYELMPGGWEPMQALAALRTPPTALKLGTEAEG